MHELSVCRGLLQQVADIAATHQQPQVSRIQLRIGPLAGVEPQLLQQAFTIARQGSVAEQAELAIEAAPLIVHCPDCGQDSPASLPRLDCGHCGQQQTQLKSGDELLLLSIAFPSDAHQEQQDV
ncbi:MAG: hydrogenase maturation nickel metallochaperone HypA [Gammaproteobacteria bacterium]|nr:hydrogenase maturation nickel metallochaperone HypA [Gammaproteobacteria bacterium]